MEKQDLFQKEELSEVLGFLEAVYYQKGYRLSEKGETDLRLFKSTMYDLLRDLPGGAVKAAAYAWAQTEPWPPTPADLREMVLTQGIPDAGEQWGKVKRCLGASERLKELPMLTQKTVSDMGGLEAGIGHCNEEVARAHFMKIFEQNAGRERRSMCVSPEVNLALSKTVNEMNINEPMLLEEKETGELR